MPKGFFHDFLMTYFRIVPVEMIIIIKSSKKGVENRRHG